MDRTPTDKRVTVVLPADLHHRLKLLAVSEDTTIQALYLQALTEFLSNRKDYSDTAF